MEAGRYGHDEPRESESAIQPGPEREVNPRERKAEQGQHGHRPQREVMAGQVFLQLQNAGEEQRAEPKMQAQQHLRELAGRPDGQAEVDEQTSKPAHANRETAVEQTEPSIGCSPRGQCKGHTDQDERAEDTEVQGETDPLPGDQMGDLRSRTDRNRYT